jgi:hypothetical protein
METLRLQTIQKPAHVEGLLQSLVKSLGILPDGSDKVADRSELPSALQKVVIKATKDGQSWRAWMHGGVHIWLFVAEMSLPLSRERGSPLIQVKSYREDGLRESANWLVDRQGKWHRCID